VVKAGLSSLWTRLNADVEQEVIEQLTELRAIMRRNYDNGNVEKIPQQRWCSGDSPWLFKERWEKIFEDWVGVKQEKFDPSRVSELYDSVSQIHAPRRPCCADGSSRSNMIVYTTGHSCLQCSTRRARVRRRSLEWSTRTGVSLIPIGR
jgi:hypothetical protein